MGLQANDRLKEWMDDDDALERATDAESENDLRSLGFIASNLFLDFVLSAGFWYHLETECQQEILLKVGSLFLKSADRMAKSLLWGMIKLDFSLN